MESWKIDYISLYGTKFKLNWKKSVVHDSISYEYTRINLFVVSINPALNY